MVFSADQSQNIVPITQFDCGKAPQIFDQLHSKRHLTVLKNDQPVAVILSLEEYARLMEIEENYSLLLEANRRLEENQEKPSLSFQTVLDDLGLSEADLEETEGMQINDLAD